MTEDQNPKRYDLEERSFEFAKRIRAFVARLPRTQGNFEDGKQVIRSSGSIAANYIKANESLSKKDFHHRIRIARKEAKESRLWLRLLDVGGEQDGERERASLVQESVELMRILATILRNSGGE